MYQPHTSLYRSDQSGYRCRLSFGQAGAREGAERQDIVVVVDTLRFSTTIAAAVRHGAAVYPCLEDEEAEDVACRVGAIAAVKRPAPGQPSLSPASFEQLASGSRVALASLNGATCSRYAATAPFLLAGALVNAGAVAERVTRLLAGPEQADHPHGEAELCVTINACGERWQPPNEDGALRFAIEDYLAAGAILAGIHASKSPEAQVCEAAFLGCRDRLIDLLMGCASGRELISRGLRDDVLYAAQLDLLNVAPMMRGGWFSA